MRQRLLTAGHVICLPEAAHGGSCWKCGVQWQVSVATKKRNVSMARCPRSLLPSFPASLPLPFPSYPPSLPLPFPSFPSLPLSFPAQPHALPLPFTAASSSPSTPFHSHPYPPSSLDAPPSLDVHPSLLLHFPFWTERSTYSFLRSDIQDIYSTRLFREPFSNYKMVYRCACSGEPIWPSAASGSSELVEDALPQEAAHGPNDGAALFAPRSRLVDAADVLGPALIPEFCAKLPSSTEPHGPRAQGFTAHPLEEADVLAKTSSPQGPRHIGAFTAAPRPGILALACAHGPKSSRPSSATPSATLLDASTP